MLPRARQGLQGPVASAYTCVAAKWPHVDSLPFAPTPRASQALRGTKEVQALVEALGIDASNVAVVLTQVGACSRGVCSADKGLLKGVQLADVQRQRCGGAHAGKLGGVRSGIPPRNIAKCV